MNTASNSNSCCPLVSLLVPVYGVERYIVRCAHSLFGQTYENIEYVIVDDCTPDNSINLLLDVLRKYPLRQNQVRIIQHEHNKGLGEARNTAIATATGEFIMHVDSDDYISKDCVRLCVEKQQSTNADIVSIGIVKKYSTKEITVNIPKYETSTELNIAVLRHDIPNNIWGRLIRKSLYIKNRIKVEGVNMSEDINVLARLLYYANNIAFVNETFYFYECSNANSYTSSFSESKCYQSLQTLNLLWLFFKEKDKKLLKALYFRMGNSLFDMSKNCVRAGGNKAFFSKLSDYIHLIPKDTFCNLSLPVQFGLRLRYYGLFKLYILVITAMKKFFRI